MATLKQHYEKVETYYKQMQKASSTATRIKYFDLIRKEIIDCPMLNSYWKIQPREHLYRNRVVNIKIFVEEEKITFTSVYVDADKTLQDGINYSTPARGGLYFLGATHFNPFTKEEFYWVKIGKAKDFASRLSQYNTCNPMCYRIDFKQGAQALESWYHTKLRAKCIAKCNHNQEWFLVSRETYLEMCQKGFDYFN